MRIGGWLPWASPQGESGHVLQVNTPLPLTSLASPHAATSAVSSGLRSTPSTSTMVAASGPLSLHLVSVSPLEPASMPNRTSLPRGPFQRRSRPAHFPHFCMALPSNAPAAATSLLSAPRVPVHGSQPPRPPRTRTSPHPFFRTALRRRLRMPIWDGDTACGLCGEVLDMWGDHAICCSGGGDRVLHHNAVRNVVCSAVSEFTSVSPELEKPGLLLPPQPPDPDDSGPGLAPVQHPPILLVAALLMYGSHAASRDSPRRGTFQSLLSFALPSSPPPTRP